LQPTLHRCRSLTPKTYYKQIDNAYEVILILTD
jgi:hypothetical protein